MANIYWNYSLEEPNTPPGWYNNSTTHTGPAPQIGLQAFNPYPDKALSLLYNFTTRVSSSSAYDGLYSWIIGSCFGGDQN